jgi:hypothetical protein
MRPSALKALVERELEYESNRHLKKQWRKFVQWLTQRARVFSRYEQVHPSGGAKAAMANARRPDDHARRQTDKDIGKAAASAQSESHLKKVYSPWHRYGRIARASTI